MEKRANNYRFGRRGFSLVEVVLALGIFLITVIALVGLLGPSLQSINEVERAGEVTSVVNTVNAFLQSSPEIVGGGSDSKFDLIFNAVAQDDFATIYVFPEYIGNSEETKLTVGFSAGETMAGGALGAGSTLANARFDDAAGTIYRVILTPSSGVPVQNSEPPSDAYRSATRSTSTGTYDLLVGLADYAEGYFAMEVRIFAEDPGPTFTVQKGLDQFLDVEPIFDYDTGILR